MKALAIGRVSTKIQAENNHSLDMQRTNIDKMAIELDCTIVHRWEMAISSRTGKNLKRKDLNEAKDRCRHDKTIKYILLDKVNRLGREAQYLTWYMLEMELKYGVRIIFCDPTQKELNGTDSRTFLRRVEKLVEAEAENEERAGISNVRMRERVNLGYYPFHTHQGYKKTDAGDGLHIPDEPRFSLLRKALKDTASFKMTPKEAQKWLETNGYRTPIFYRKDKDGHKIQKGGRVLSLNHFSEIMKMPYYAGTIELKGWPVKKNALHKPMITVEELEINIATAKGRKIRRQLKHNPDFKLNTSFHEPCIREKNGKLTGINHRNNKSWSRKEYVCRACHKSVEQEKAHASMSSLLESLVLGEKGLKELKEALKLIWHTGEAYRLERIKSLNSRKVELGEKKTQMIHSLSANPDLGEDIKLEISKIKAEITEIDIQVTKDGKVDDEFMEFSAYALDYSEDLRKRWWDLTGEKLNECKQLLFRSKIIIQPDGNVYTPDLSYIYTLKNKKDDKDIVKNASMVELPAIAAGSVSLSWLVVYRLSLF